jgi:hypothetical protein
MIEAGDKVDGYLVTKGNPEDVTYHWQLEDKKGENPNEYLLDVSQGTKFNPTLGIYDGTYSGKLDATWAELSSYELFINDHPVKLDTFGTIDVKHPMVGMMRHWNVVIVADKPGEIKVREAGTFQGDPVDGLLTITIKPPVSAPQN